MGNNDRYKEAGYGSGSVGIGKNPALLIVDFQKAFTSPRSPLGGSKIIDEAVNNTAKLLEVARKASIPVIHTYVAYRPDKKDMGQWPSKVSSLSTVEIGSEWAELDERVKNEEDEVVLLKKMPSAFFNTDLINILITHQIDTLIVCGCTTSGCIRATVVDSFSYGFRTIVVEDCVGDQELEPQKVNLSDIKKRYGDIYSLNEIIEYLESIYKKV